jgi:hypothetical protein
LEPQQNEILNELRKDFYRHEAVCEEKWKTVFNQLGEGIRDSKERHNDMRASLLYLQKLVLTTAGAIILFLAGVLVSGGII